MRKLLVRTLTALTFIGIVLAMLVLSKQFQAPWVVALLAFAVTLVASREFVTLANCFKLELEPRSLVALNGLYIASAMLFDGRYALWTLTLALVWPLLWYALKRLAFKHTLVSWFSLFYIPVLLQFTYQIFRAAGGGFLLVFLLGSVWAYDSGAFLSGSLWGREKLMPEVSPAKTWEGVLGGSVAVLLLTLSAPLWVPGLSWSVPWLLVALFLSIATQLGDLFESWLKRVARVKDAGEILPGHGGMLDRIDGLLFAAPVFYFYLRHALHLI